MNSLVQQCTMEAADVRGAPTWQRHTTRSVGWLTRRAGWFAGRELLAFDEERNDLRGAVVQRSADTDKELREMRASTAKAISPTGALLPFRTAVCCHS